MSTCGGTSRPNRISAFCGDSTDLIAIAPSHSEGLFYGEQHMIRFDFDDDVQRTEVIESLGLRVHQVTAQFPRQSARIAGQTIWEIGGSVSGLEPHLLALGAKRTRCKDFYFLSDPVEQLRQIDPASRLTYAEQQASNKRGNDPQYIQKQIAELERPLRRELRYRKSCLLPARKTAQVKSRIEVSQQLEANLRERLDYWESRLAAIQRSEVFRMPRRRFALTA
jgi:hypothetical protein